MSAAASHRAEVGLRACCWVWCARVQSVGPCSRYVCSLRCARVRVRARRAGASAPCAERVGFAPPAGCGARACRASGRARASSCVARVTCSHRRGGSAARADRAPARALPASRTRVRATDGDVVGLARARAPERARLARAWMDLARVWRPQRGRRRCCWRRDLVGPVHGARSRRTWPWWSERARAAPSRRRPCAKAHEFFQAPWAE